MELSASLVLAACVVVLLVFLIRRDSGKKYNLPPGPSPLPVIGNLHQLDIKCLFQCFAKLSERYGPVMTVYLGSQRMVVLNGFEAVWEALQDHADEFSGRAHIPIMERLTEGYGLLVSNGERWRQLRRFSLTTLRNYGMGKRSIEEWIQEEARNLVEEFRKNVGSPCDPTFFLSRAVSNVICSMVFGERFEYQDKNFIRLLGLINSTFRLITSPWTQIYNTFPRVLSCLPGPHNRVLENVKELKAFIAEMIERHKQELKPDSPRDYIDSFLVKIQEEKESPSSEFHDKSMLNSVLNLFAAGTETTSTTLRYGLLLLIKYPHFQDRVQQEIDSVVGRDRPPAMEDRRKMPITDATIHEIQRFADIVPLNIPHKTTRDTSFRGYSIPEGTVVLPVLHSVLYDETQWSSPNSFDPTNFLDENSSFRKNRAFLPFSTGKRSCAGEGLARMELFLFFTTLLQNLSFRSQGDPGKMDVTPEVSTFSKVPRRFELIVRSR
ncbi:cytochrome P450 2C8-like [Acipenser ruthenus]|uniref:cytochrome P450 2C8-like n=1 Tax=Acipenser ruthenus TaxID=7906 RepID=UPI00145BD2FC|nr:cytochrome P450 2C8-like [Acipenser ruthenus]